MKHAKRMVLVPEDVLNRYEQKQKLETAPIMTNMMHQDTEILQNASIPMLKNRNCTMRTWKVI